LVPPETDLSAALGLRRSFSAPAAGLAVVFRCQRYSGCGS